MKIINTANMPDDLTDDEIYWAYNGLDCVITEAIFQNTSQLLEPHSKVIYDRALQLQVPLLEMQMRGMKVDLVARNEVLQESYKTLDRITANFDRLVLEGIGLETPINAASPTQVKYLFYTVLGLKEIKAKNQNGYYSATVGREALEKLSSDFYAEVFANHILAIRDLKKLIGFLKTKLSDDNRIRCNFNITGTNTGRLASSVSDFGDGTNLQNVTPAARRFFTADDGKILVNIDLEQADSRNVGAICWDLFVDMPREEISKLLQKSNLLKDGQEWEGPIGEEFAGSYLDACESGDLHTTVASMAYPDAVHDRATADLIAYRGKSYRDLSKGLGHGTNYLGQPHTMAAHSKLPIKICTAFQQGYFGQFPCIKAWHIHDIAELTQNGYLTNLFGRRRHFFNKLDLQDTWNAAIAFKGQSMTGEEMNIGMINLWQNKDIEMLIQVHDSILFQCDRHAVNEIVPTALKQLETHLELKRGRDFFVPLEAMTGYNWGYGSQSNHHGLLKFKGNETRTPPRKRFLRKTSLLEKLSETKIRQLG